MATICSWEQQLDDTEAKDLAEKLKNAMRGLGTSEEEIIEVLVSHNNNQRQKIKDAYTGYGDLIEDLKSELGGDFEDAIIALMTPTVEYETRLLHDAINGPGTCENTLVGILCTRNNDEMEAIKAKYKEMYDADLGEELQSDVSGDFGTMIYALVASGRQEESADEGQATEEAQKLIDAGIGCLGTDESEFNFILCKSSYSQLRCIMEKYRELTGGNDLIQDIDSEMSGNLKEGFLAMLKVARDKCAYFAERIHNAMAGAGTDEGELMRILICRAEIDLEIIKERYTEAYGSNMEEDIDNETSGDFSKVLRSVVRGRYVG